MINYHEQSNYINSKIKTMDKLKKELRMEVDKVLMTPQKAKQILSYNDGNRNLAPARVRRLSDDILKGLWIEDTGDFIKISINGNLLDGQHRLASIVKADISVRLWVCYNVPENAKTVIDTGRARTSSDIFKIDGIKNSGLSTAIQMSHVLTTYGNFTVGYDGTLSAQELLKKYSEKPDYYQECFSQGQKLSKLQSIMTPLQIAGYMIAFDKINRLKSRSFMNQLCEGVNVENNVVILLRNKLISDRLNQKSKMSKKSKKGFMIKAFNIFCQDKKIKVLRYNPESEGKMIIGA